MGLDPYEVDDTGFAPWTLSQLNRQPMMDGVDIRASDFLISQYDTDYLEDCIRNDLTMKTNTKTPNTRQSWGNKSVIKLVSKIYYEVPATERYQSINWLDVDPELLMHILHSDDGIDPATFRAQLRGWGESLSNLMDMYFVFHRRGGAEPSEQQSACLEQWRSMIRWVLTGVTAEELCDDRYSEPSALVEQLCCRWWICQDRDSLLPCEIRGFQRMLTRILTKWLEDLESAGVPLREYGRLHLAAYKSSDCQYKRCEIWDVNLDQRNSEIGPYLISFTYGKRPKDWELHWDSMVEEFAGQFFEMLEEQRYRIPGAWVH